MRLPNLVFSEKFGPMLVDTKVVVSKPHLFKSDNKWGCKRFNVMSGSFQSAYADTITEAYEAPFLNVHFPRYELVKPISSPSAQEKKS